MAGPRNWFICLFFKYRLESKILFWKISPDDSNISLWLRIINIISWRTYNPHEPTCTTSSLHFWMPFSGPGTPSRCSWCPYLQYLSSIWSKLTEFRLLAHFLFIFFIFYSFIYPIFFSPNFMQGRIWVKWFHISLCGLWT